MKIRGKIKKGKVTISSRTKAKIDDLESSLNSNSSVEPTLLSGRRPVQNMNFMRNMKTYQRQPEKCSTPGSSLKAGFTFLMLAVSSMLILCGEPAPRCC